MAQTLESPEAVADVVATWRRSSARGRDDPRRRGSGQDALRDLPACRRFGQEATQAPPPRYSDDWYPLRQLDNDRLRGAAEGDTFGEQMRAMASRWATTRRGVTSLTSQR
jgi:hypothetical protein